MKPTIETDRYSLYLADCLDVLPTLQDGSVDAVVTDPPYGILNLEGKGSTPCVRKYPRQCGSGTLKNRLLNRSDVAWDSSAPSKETLNALRDMSKWQVFWGGNYFDLPPCRAMLVWDKEQPWENFSQVEMAWTNLQSPAGLFRESVVRSMPNKTHPTQKPVSLMIWCLNRVGETAKVILDPFMGSGTTGVACMKLGRKFVGVEIDPNYFAIAAKRIAKAAEEPPLFKMAREAEQSQLEFGENER